MNSQFKKGVIEMCVLHIVAQKDIYGFAVIEAISKEIDVNENTIYPILRRLTEQGYFDTFTEATGIGAPRKYYTITNQGRLHLDEYESEWRKFSKGVFNLLGGEKHER
ncbi:MAG: PadR family transcriptional regulator [Candidatus Izemoplasmatales bacterium]|nr:PadR family transcriptional regulator [Candidatus Izemoplasmatales bacterium]MDD3865774.1 PadR family transcriptional regulator [Candidatus Izemoplasmatales bacterium]